MFLVKFRYGIYSKELYKKITEVEGKETRKGKVLYAILVLRLHGVREQKKVLYVQRCLGGESLIQVPLPLHVSWTDSARVGMDLLVKWFWRN